MTHTGTRSLAGSPSPSKVRRLAVLVGIVGSVATLPLHLAVPHNFSVVLAAVVLIVIGAIYIGFSIMTETVAGIVGESVVATLFIAAGVAAMYGWWWMVPMGYALHGGWDLLHHARHLPAMLVRPPVWYPPFCAAYDWLFAVGITAIWLS